MQFLQIVALSSRALINAVNRTIPASCHQTSVRARLQPGRKNAKKFSLLPQAARSDAERDPKGAGAKGQSNLSIFARVNSCPDTCAVVLYDHADFEERWERVSTCMACLICPASLVGSKHGAWLDPAPHFPCG
jgi:hypothetical protein